MKYLYVLVNQLDTPMQTFLPRIWHCFSTLLSRLKIMLFGAYRHALMPFDAAQSEITISPNVINPLDYQTKVYYSWPEV